VFNGTVLAGLDALRAKMVRTGAPSDAIDLIVVDERGERIPGPLTH